MPTAKAPPARGNTKPTQYRLPDVTLAQLDQIAASIGTTSRAAAIRYAAQKIAETLAKTAKTMAGK